MKLSLIIFMVLGFLFFCGFFSSAAANAYPILPGGTVSITENSSLGNAIKYFAGWAIILGALIAFAVLIKAGFKYLTATGNPAQMTDARGNIFNSFLGLLILLGSYVILNTLNPQITVTNLERKPVESGIVVLNKEGEQNWASAGYKTGDIDKAGIKNQLFLSPGDIPDAEKIYGKLVFSDDFNTNLNTIEAYFKDLQPDFIACLISGAKNPFTEVFMYEGKNFQGTTTQFTTDEQTCNNPIAIESFTTDFSPLNKNYFGQDEIPSQSGTKTPVKITDGKKIKHPPLSFKVVYTGPGVYLYAANKADQLSSPQSLNILGNFDDRAEYLKIRNREPDNDYLTVLFEDENYKGQFRIFFENKTRPGVGAKAGNVEISADPNKFTEIKITDIYGKVNKTSSLFVNQINSDPGVCKEVKLCTGEGSDDSGTQNECIIFTPQGGSVELKDTVWRALSAYKLTDYYIPKSLPSGVTVKKLKKDGSGEETKSTPADFNNNIRSVHITGKCLVVLFENELDDAGNWKKGGPGEKSEIFTATNPGLHDNRSNNCSPPGSFLGIGPKVPCSSAIAIYPIRY